MMSAFLQLHPTPACQSRISVLGYLLVIISQFLINWHGICVDFRLEWCFSSQSHSEGNNWAICAVEDGLWMTFMIVAVGGKMVRSEKRVLRLCAWFRRKANGAVVSNKRAL